MRRFITLILHEHRRYNDFYHTRNTKRIRNMENSGLMACESAAGGNGVSRHLTPWWAVAACLMVSFAGLMDHDLWTPDEPREAAIALHAALSGDYIVPHLAGEPFVEKPPLYYAVGAMLIRFAESALWRTNLLRLGSAFWGLGAVLMTWLLARRLYGKGAGAAATLMLATFPGFVHVTHWLLTDNALLFFITAAVWAMAEAYEGRRPAFLILAAVFAAGAFLSKGLIGPVVAGLAWAGLFAPWAARLFREQDRRVVMGAAALHAVAALVFIAICGAWILAFKARVGPERFHEWLVANHAGRFSGAAGHLGHISGPFYYLPIVPLYVLPWLAPICAGLWRLLRELREKGLCQTALVPLLWGLGGLLLFSISATKREIYLSALLPAFALMAAKGVACPVPQWVWKALRAWQRLCLAMIALVVFALLTEPLWARWAAGYAPANCGVSAGIGLLGLFAALAIGAAGRDRDLGKALAMTAVLYILGLSVCCPVIDRHKSYGPAFRVFAGHIGSCPGLKPAGWRLDETSRAGLYYYAGMILPEIGSEAEAEAAVAGRHPEYNAVVQCIKGGTAEDHGGEKLFSVKMGRRRTMVLLGRGGRR